MYLRFIKLTRHKIFFLLLTIHSVTYQVCGGKMLSVQMIPQNMKALVKDKEVNIAVTYHPVTQAIFKLLNFTLIQLLIQIVLPRRHSKSSIIFVVGLHLGYYFRTKKLDHDPNKTFFEFAEMMNKSFKDKHIFSIEFFTLLGSVL